MKIAETFPHSPVYGEGVWETEARRWLAFLPSCGWIPGLTCASGLMEPERRGGLAALICSCSSPADSSLGGWVLQGGVGPTASGCLGARSFLVAKASADRAGRSRVGLSRPLQPELSWGCWWGASWPQVSDIPFERIRREGMSVGLVFSRGPRC